MWEGRLQLTVRDSWSKLLAPKINKLWKGETVYLAIENIDEPFVNWSRYTNINLNRKIILLYREYSSPLHIAISCLWQDKLDHEKIIYIVPIRVSFEWEFQWDIFHYRTLVIHHMFLTQKNTRNHLFWWLVADASSQASLVIDQEIVYEVKNINNCTLSLLSSLHVFNMCYPKGCNNLFCFLEMQLLGMTPIRVPTSVNHFCLVSISLMHFNFVLGS